jgi:hypothetical protein
MTIALNSVRAAPAVQPVQPYVPVVSHTADAGVSSVAASLSAESAVVASLGASAGVAVYTPQGLLNSIEQAGKAGAPVAVPPAGSETAALAEGYAQQQLDQGIVGSLSGTPATSGVYTGAGALDQPSAQASSNWAELLKTHPALAGAAVADSLNAALVGSLITQA